MAEFLFTDPQGQKFKITAPEGATEAEAFSMLQGQAPQPQATEPAPQQRTPKEELLRALGRTARVGVTAATGLGGAIADVPFQLTNVGRATFDKPPLELPSAAQQKLMTRIGLPQSEGTYENVVDTLATMVGGAAIDPVSRALQLATAASPAAQAYKLQLPEKARNVQALMKAGYKPPPTIAEAGAGSRLLEGLGGSNRLATELQTPHQAVTNKLYREAIDLPKNADLNYETLRKLSGETWRAGYEPVKNVVRIKLDPTFRKDLLNAVDEFGMTSENLPFASSTKVRNLVGNYLFKGTSPSGKPLVTTQLTGKEAVNHIRNLRAEANNLLKKSGEPEAIALGKANKAIADAIEDNLSRNLTGATLQNYRAARTKIAQIKVGEESLLEGTGNIDASKIAGMLNEKAPLTGNLKTIGLAGNLLGKAVDMPTGKPPIMDWQDRIMLGAGSMAGLAAGQVPLAGMLIPLAGYPLARRGMRSLIKRPGFQEAYVAPSSVAAPGIFGNPLTQRAIPSLYPLFTGGEE